MIGVYVDNRENDDVSREDVADETNIETLLEWLAQFRSQESELGIMLATLRTDKDAFTVGMTRKLAYIRVAIGWVTERLGALGHEVEDTSYGGKLKNMKVQLAGTQAALEKRNKSNKELRAKIAELEAALLAAQVSA